MPGPGPNGSDPQAEALASALLGIVSHELRTPLHAMLGYARLLEGGPGAPLDETRLTYVRRIVGLAQDLARLIDDMLVVGELQAGTLVPERRPADLAGLLAQEAARLATEAAGRDVALDLAAAGPAIVSGDAALLARAVAALLGNAIKYSDAGSRIRAAIVAGDGAVRLEISDGCGGLGPEVLERLYRPFHRGDMSGTRAHGGAGLGLALAQGIAAIHGGEVGARNEPAGGCTFWMRLPTGARRARPTSEPDL